MRLGQSRIIPKDVEMGLPITGGYASQVYEGFLCGEPVVVKHTEDMQSFGLTCGWYFYRDSLLPVLTKFFLKSFNKGNNPDMIPNPVRYVSLGAPRNR